MKSIKKFINSNFRESLFKEIRYGERELKKKKREEREINRILKSLYTKRDEYHNYAYYYLEKCQKSVTTTGETPVACSPLY